MFQAIGRLSSDDPELIQTSCCIMNRVCTKGKYLQDMIEKIKNLDKEKELNQRPINEGMIKEIDSHKVKFQIMSTIELVKGIILKLIF